MAFPSQLHDGASAMTPGRRLAHPRGDRDRLYVAEARWAGDGCMLGQGYPPYPATCSSLGAEWDTGRGSLS